MLRELWLLIKTSPAAGADAVCGAEYGTSSPEWTNRRNGYRHREFGTSDVAIPKLREDTYVPEWLLHERVRAGRLSASSLSGRRWSGRAHRRPTAGRRRPAAHTMR